MLANRQPIVSLITGILLGAAGAIKLAPDSVLVVLIISTCGLLCFTKTSERKVLMFLAGGFATALIDFVIYSQSSLVEMLAYIAAIVLSTFYLTDSLSK